jgi:hypothetical protein
VFDSIIRDSKSKQLAVNVVFSSGFGRLPHKLSK